MRNIGLVTSSIAHVVVLGWGLVSLPTAETHDVSKLEILPVELVRIADVTDVKKGEAKGEVKKVIQEETKKKPELKVEPPKKEAPKVEPKPKVPEPKPKTAPPKVEPKPAPPKPEPKVEPEPKIEEKPQEPKAEAPKPIAALPKIKPKPPKKKPVKKTAKKKRSFDSDALKALANKADSATEVRGGEQDQKASFGSRTGNQAAAMTQSELDALRAQVARCWSPPVGAADASQLVVRIGFGLDRNGEVISGPTPIEYPASSFGLAAVESAMRAVRRCAPYENLPADKYESWKRVNITFDPQDMF